MHLTIVDFAKLISKDSFLRRNTTPSESLSTTFLCALVFIVPWWAAGRFYPSLALKPIVILIVGVVLCLLLIFPAHAVRKALSLQLRASMVNTVVLLYFVGAGSFAIGGYKFPFGLILILVMLLAWILCFEPMIYRFMKRKSDRRELHQDEQSAL